MPGLKAPLSRGGYTEARRSQTQFHGIYRSYVISFVSALYTQFLAIVVFK